MKLTTFLPQICALVSVFTAALPTLAQQTTTLFDTNWRFHRGQVENAQAPNFNDNSWRRVQLPHDWSIEDLPPAALQLTLSDNKWRFHTGDDAAWKAPNYDDSAWTLFASPATYQELPDFAPNSYGWYRRKISVPADLRGKAVELIVGKVDDVDETFINGVKVGATGTVAPDYRGAYNELRHYPVPATLLKGDGSDVVAVRVYNGEGAGGIFAPATSGSQRSGPFDNLAAGGAAQGFSVGGVGWYRKTFTVATTARNRSWRLNFDGVYMDSTVYFNGQELGKHSYGYTAFSFDLTPLMRIGQPNTIAVRVDSSGLTSRWYSGSGIYRHVTLTDAPLLHIAENGTFVSTPQANLASATVKIRTVLRNANTIAQAATLTLRVLDSAGKTIATSKPREISRRAPMAKSSSKSRCRRRVCGRRMRRICIA